MQRIHAELFQHGVALPETSIRWARTRELLEDDALEISPAGRQRVLTAYRMIDAITIESRPLKADLQRFGLKQPGCRALVDSQYGIGGLLAVTLWSELGDCQRFARSEQVVRHSGLDVTVDQSDRRRAGGFISRQGPQTLRWALYEAAKNASHQRSPDHDYYADVKDHLNGKLATISMARKLARRCFHVLARRRSRRRLRDALITAAEVDARHRPPEHHGSSRGQLPQPACPPASVLDGLQTLTRPRTHNRGGHPIRDVVADDEFVEHPGNAGRPRTIKPRPIASMHRPSGWSRSFVLASLRALHLDQHLRPGALRAKRALTPTARTGNAGLMIVREHQVEVCACDRERSERCCREPEPLTLRDRRS